MSMILDDIELSETELEQSRTMADKNHSKMQFRLSTALAEYEEQRRISIFPEVDLDLQGWLVRPDISLLPYMDYDWEHDEIVLQTVPLVAIEITSARQPVSDLFDKARKYFAHGVQSCWIIIPPTRTITVLSPLTKTTSYSSGILTDPATGITISLDDIFR